MKTYPVAEIFGPTIQGEGVDQGIPCNFVRFGGCDFKCDWCDTPHAVLAPEVRELPRMDEKQILDALSVLPDGPSWVVLSGGNPALHELGGLTARIQQDLNMKVAVETQGTRWKSWLGSVNRLCVSPKPPSSKMQYSAENLMEFLEKTYIGYLHEGMWNQTFEEFLFVKVVVFDDEDYEFAKDLNREILGWGRPVPVFVSAGNDAGRTVGQPDRIDPRNTYTVKNDLFNQARWLAEKVMNDTSMSNVRVQAQFHVALWGNELGR